MGAIGFVAATIGSLAGLGGGFLVAPVLRIFFGLPPDEAAATSLVLVLGNVASASVAFLRQGRVDVRLAMLMGIAAIPGSILGALLVKHAPAAWFDILYAGILTFLAVDMVRNSGDHVAGHVRRLPWATVRHFHDPVTGEDYTYTESRPIAAGAGLGTGFLSSFFGIGGGVLVVPLLLRVFGMPAHIVAATSHLVILFSAPFGVATHAFAGDIKWLDALPLAAGGIVGGQLGANLSRRISGPVFVRIVAVVLTVAAASLVIQHADAFLTTRR
jgi:uncharacterized membrane protein YfcA